MIEVPLYILIYLIGFWPVGRYTIWLIKTDYHNGNWSFPYKPDYGMATVAAVIWPIAVIILGIFSIILGVNLLSKRLLTGKNLGKRFWRV